jgi:hypothetical protein
MKVLSFPHGRKNWRIMVPASKSPTGKRYVVYFSTKEAAEKKLKAIKQFGRVALNHSPAAIKRSDGAIFERLGHLADLIERYGLGIDQVERVLKREAAITKLVERLGTI